MLPPPAAAAPLRLADTQKKNQGAFSKLLPVYFVSLLITYLSYVYIRYHIWSLLQYDRSPKHVQQDMRTRGWVELAVFVYVTILLIVSYIGSIVVHPGGIPEGDPQWDYRGSTKEGVCENATSNETKRSGERRHCKWCGMYKPDRAHHCRVCQRCTLKMDHHCPWTNNCVGAFNYKYFFLLLLYSTVDSHLIFWSILESLARSVDDSADFVTMYHIFYAATLAGFIWVLITCFFSFHIWLMLEAMTTIEFCEKKSPRKHEAQGDDKDKQNKQEEPSLYNLGLLGNLRASLGPNPLLWLLPVGLPDDDGITFLMRQVLLTNDIEKANGGIRRKGHQLTPREPGSGLLYGTHTSSTATL